MEMVKNFIQLMFGQKMTGHAKSQTKKKQVLSEHQEAALADAVNTYQEEQQKPEEERRSLADILFLVLAQVQIKILFKIVEVYIMPYKVSDLQKFVMLCNVRHSKIVGTSAGGILANPISKCKGSGVNNSD
ncbi:hypothetical protein SERLA73DRAFT_149855 [Serpula lacrymans var. lacrymans S7.3]|uniref:Uncharacterized protein n=1 Tax=Serpula lacrymans var. lacrymans (strain S7.3) TaxID=936435 RepID=F8PKX4_SERL3|nr:hypothetical protein SERLA73DRAFT_149855 [Serpula lacrymans var. lacrymans S7.3]